jgi:hypothetical protein
MLKVAAGSLFIVCAWIPLLVSGDAGAQQADARLPGAFADTDIELTGVIVAAPASAFSGVPFDVTVNATIGNNGPFGPVNVAVDFTVSTPSDCTRAPGGPFETATVSLAVGATAPASKTWSVTCAEAGAHELRGTAQALIGPDFNDLNSGNNFKERTVAVTVGASPAAQPATGGAPPLPGQQGVPAADSLVTAFAAILMMGLGAGILAHRLRRG